MTFISTLSEIEFNRERFFVHFDPYVSYEDVTEDSYNEAELFPFIQTISTKFSRIVVTSPQFSEMKSNYSSCISHGNILNYKIVDLVLANLYFQWQTTR